MSEPYPSSAGPVAATTAFDCVIGGTCPNGNAIELVLGETTPLARIP